MPIFAPVFCRGVGVSQNLTSLVAGDRRGAVGSTTGLVAGQHLFASKADFTGAVYLGKVTQVAGGFVYFQFASPVATGAGGVTKVFTPSVFWQAVSVPGTGGFDTARESGIETLETTGAELLQTRVRDPRDFVEIMISSVRVSDWRAYKAFVEMELEDGLRRFTAAYMDHDAQAVRCDLVKLRGPGDARRAKTDALVLRSWALELQVLQRGFYGA